MRGLHIAVTDEELERFLDLPVDEQADHVHEILEQQKFDTADCAETDMSWAYIHAALNDTDPDGPLQFPDSAIGASEARFAITGHAAAHATQDFFVGLVEKNRVSSVSRALEAISSEEIGQRVIDVHKRYASTGSASDAAEYTMGWYPGLVAFFRHAAASGKHVIFTVDF